ncbi:MAG TPA: alpha/beta family hydrolase [Usitatibacter sp.]|nr:alpha/beta family hydrolase [Usitatibacter sp.]
MSTLASVTRRIVHIPCGALDLEGAFESPASPRGVVVFAHGSGSSRMSPRNRYVANELRRAGLATLLLDLLTEAEDRQMELRFDIRVLAERLRAAVRWTRELPACADLPMGLFGASTGAAAALEVAGALGHGIAAVVSRGGRPDLASREALAAVTAPTLLIVGERDPEVIDLNQSAYALLRCDKCLDIVPSATHLFPEAGALETVAALACEWFTRHLGGTSRRVPRDEPAGRRGPRGPSPPR